MKYVVRALKYFVYFAIILTLILTILALLGVIDSDINKMFKDGVQSVWKIAGCLAVISAVYPAFGYTKRQARVPGGMAENREKIISFMDSKEYLIEKNETELMTFRCKSTVKRVSKMWEDRITVTSQLTGVEMEGYSKDVLRLASGLEYSFREEE